MSLPIEDGSTADMVLLMGNGEHATSTVPSGKEGTIAPLSIIAIHDGYHAETQVSHAFTWLHQCFRADARMSFNAWTFEKLATALDIRAMSVRIGIESDVIIIATSGSMQLPDHIIRWLDSITGQQRQDKALVIAMEGVAGAPCPHTSILFADLQQWAARWCAELICCTDIRQQLSRQSILRRLNERLYRSPATTPDQSHIQPSTNIPSTIQETMNQKQTTMTPAQIQEVRGLAYHLWLQADRPSGREMDFWLSAEKQVIQAAAEHVAHETTLNTAPAARSAAKKARSTTKRVP